MLGMVDDPCCGSRHCSRRGCGYRSLADHQELAAIASIRRAVAGRRPRVRWGSTNRTIEWMKSCQPRANIVVPQGSTTGAYARSAKEKAIACSSTAAGHRSG
jgi:hypothetical protein